MPDTDFFRLVDSATSGRKDLEQAQSPDYETETSLAVLVKAILAPTHSASGGEIFFVYRERITDINELPSLVEAPPDITFQLGNDLTAQPQTKNYAPTFRDPEGQFWWLSYEPENEHLIPPRRLVISQGTGLEAKQITYATPALTSNPSSDQSYVLEIRAEQPLGSIQARTIQTIHIRRYAPAALYFGYPNIIPVVGGSASGDRNTFSLQPYYQNHDNRPVQAYFGSPGITSKRGLHWTYSITTDGNGLPSLMAVRDDNPNGPHYTDTRGEIVAVDVATNDNGDLSSGVITFSVSWY